MAPSVVYRHRTNNPSLRPHNNLLCKTEACVKLVLLTYQVVYYCRSSSGNIVAVDFAGNSVFNIRDVVRALLPTATSSNLTSPVLMGIMHDEVGEISYIVGSFTAKVPNTTGHTGVVFVANATSGEFLAVWSFLHPSLTMSECISLAADRASSISLLASHPKICPFGLRVSFGCRGHPDL
jgi:hypothetical protein